MNRHSLVVIVAALLCSVVGLERRAAASDLTVSGTCPGEVTFTISGWEPDTTVAVAFSTARGSLRIPNSYRYCSGTVLGLSSRNIRVLIVFQTDEFGHATHDLRLPRGACGGYVQAMSLQFCNLSPVRQLP